jgi:hypothetical protein
LLIINFVHVNIKALHQSRAIRLPRRGKSREKFANSASRQGTAWRTAWSSSSGCIRRGFHLEKDEQIRVCK